MSPSGPSLERHHSPPIAVAHFQGTWRRLQFSVRSSGPYVAIVGAACTKHGFEPNLYSTDDSGSATWRADGGQFARVWSGRKSRCSQERPQTSKSKVDARHVSAIEVYHSDASEADELGTSTGAPETGRHDGKPCACPKAYTIHSRCASNDTITVNPQCSSCVHRTCLTSFRASRFRGGYSSRTSSAQLMRDAVS